jgi:hypothetical protein
MQTNETNGDDLPVLISPDEVSDCFNIQPETLTAWRKSGEGPPFYKINGTVIGNGAGPPVAPAYAQAGQP